MLTDRRTDKKAYSNIDIKNKEIYKVERQQLYTFSKHSFKQGNKQKKYVILLRIPLNWKLSSVYSVSYPTPRKGQPCFQHFLTFFIRKTNFGMVSSHLLPSLNLCSSKREVRRVGKSPTKMLESAIDIESWNYFPTFFLESEELSI